MLTPSGVILLLTEQHRSPDLTCLSNRLFSSLLSTLLGGLFSSVDIKLSTSFSNTLSNRERERERDLKLTLYLLWFRPLIIPLMSLDVCNKKA